MQLAIRGSARSRLLTGIVLTAILAVLPATAAAATTAPHVAGSADSTGSAVISNTAAGPAAPADSQLGIDMQTQQQDEWCWVASGDTIATYLGNGTDQNTFCDLAQGYDTSQQCPDQAGELSYDQTAFSALGLSPGTEAGGPTSFDQIVSDINANHPEETGIAWTAGGGHAEVIYGYDSSSQSIYYGDPWPDDQRMNEVSYSYYVSNDQFNWTDTLYGIGA